MSMYQPRENIGTDRVQAFSRGWSFIQMLLSGAYFMCEFIVTILRWKSSGIPTVKTGAAVSCSGSGSDQFMKTIGGKIGQAVRTNQFTDLVDGMMAGDQVLPGVNICSVVAGI